MRPLLERDGMSVLYAVLQSQDKETNLRHGADTRVTSAVTLVFLPSTFFGATFRTSFWNFDLSTTGPVVSRWIWLYWFLTAVLTVFVFAIWWNFFVVKQLRKKMTSTWEHASAA